MDQAVPNQSYWAKNSQKAHYLRVSIAGFAIVLMGNQMYQLLTYYQNIMTNPYAPWSFGNSLVSWSTGILSGGAFLVLKLILTFYWHQFRSRKVPLVQLHAGPYTRVSEETEETEATEDLFSSSAPASQKQGATKRSFLMRTLCTRDTLLLLPMAATHVLHKLRVRISFAVKLTVTVIASNGHRVVELNRRYAAILAFIAHRARERAVEAKEMRQRFYRSLAKDTPYQDKRMMRKKVNTVAKELDADAPWIELFQRQPHKPTYTALQLSDECEIEEPTLLDAHYERVQMARDHPNEIGLYPLEQLRSDAMEHLKKRDGLFLMDDLEAAPHLWQWAMADFQHYREKWVVVLLYSAQREHKAGMQAVDQRSKEDHFQKAVDCCRAVLDATSRIFPDSRHGNEALNLFLRLCLFLGTGRDAKIGYSRFVRRMQRLEPKWTPGEEIERLYWEVVTPNPVEH